MTKKIIKCLACGFIAKSEGGLRVHQRAKHLNQGPYNLTPTTPEESATLVAHMTQLIMSPGWQILKQFNDYDVALLEQAILTRNHHVAKTVMTETELDDARRRREIMLALIERPEQLIEAWSGGKNVGLSQIMDPYASDVKQLNRTSDNWAETLVDVADKTDDSG